MKINKTTVIVTNCCSTGSHRPHRRCPVANNVENVDRGQVWECPSVTARTALLRVRRNLVPPESAPQTSSQSVCPLLLGLQAPTSIEQWWRLPQERTRSRAIAEGPRGASCQLKSCQLPRDSAETTGWLKIKYPILLCKTITMKIAIFHRGNLFGNT